ncbi:uncharacterized protein BX663DRAFT_491944 [Cokeromyces recurvatus]|uniref:uncharacterized protein n=1 Tax=Cokeromyces recurvatus TaxID=90255 RepID=UPI00221E6245|nr:uncharacterized protein BX663DRAFT_491944 [Cokeromyces recurvatus]KAI7907761.1 hypothetical protein BX663DRAFT_491944 [Cokeromyces recurvatus]
MLAKEQARTLKEYSESLPRPDPQQQLKECAERLSSSSPELAKDPNAAGGKSNALRLRLDINLDASIRLKARIKGPIKITFV